MFDRIERMSDDCERFGDDLGEGPGRRRVLPAGFADLPGGPELAAAIGAVDVAACNGYELEEYIKATRRIVCWAESTCLTGVNELTCAEPGMCEGPTGRRVVADSMTPVVLEPLLGWTAYRAAKYVSLAATLPSLPRVRDALASGQLEPPEVHTIVDRITDAKPDLWGAIEDALFPKVLELRGGLLRAKVEAEVVKADPEAAAKRHRAARTGRNVAIWPAIDGVADLSIRGLSADQAAEAYGYIDAIARAEKSTGDPRTLGQLRADVAYSLLSGAAEIIDCSAPPVVDNHAEQDRAQGEAAQDEAVKDRPAQDHPEFKQGKTEQGNEQADAEPDETEPDEIERAEGESEQEPRVQGHCSAHRFPDHDLHYDWCECGDCAPAQTGRLRGVRTWCTCSTTHDTAAHEAAQNTASQDGAAETGAENAATSTAGDLAAGQVPQQNRRPDDTADPPGQPGPPAPPAPPAPPDPATDNSTLPPPPPWTSSQPSWGPIRTRAKIQLNMPLTTLMGLSTRPGELGGFGPIITEVARRIVANNLANPEARFTVGITHPVTGRLLHLHPIPARFLRGLQAELVHARDQRCVWTTCRRPAATCHLDHNTEHADGGETSVDNIAPLCPRHHKAKTERDWKLKQTGPREHTLTDPFGRQYTSGAPSLTDPAPPEPATGERATATAGAQSADDDLPPF